VDRYPKNREGGTVRSLVSRSTPFQKEGAYFEKEKKKKKKKKQKKGRKGKKKEKRKVRRKDNKKKGRGARSEL